MGPCTAKGSILHPRHLELGLRRTRVRTTISTSRLGGGESGHNAEDPQGGTLKRYFPASRPAVMRVHAYRKLIAGVSDANRFQRAAQGRRRKSGSRHQFAKEKPGFGVSDRRLHANPDQAIGVIYRLPRVNGQL